METLDGCTWRHWLGVHGGIGWVYQRWIQGGGGGGGGGHSGHVPPPPPIFFGMPLTLLAAQLASSAYTGADPGIGSGGGGGGGAKLDAEPPRGGCGRGAPLPPS